MKELNEIASDAGERTAHWLLAVGRILSVLVLLAGLATLVGSVYIAVRAYTPVWFADEWGVPMDYKALGSHYPLWKFWAQHNEHRIPIMKAAQLLDLFWLKGDRRPLLVLNRIIQACLWCAVMFFLYVLRRFSAAELATLAGSAAFFVFNPNQMPNFYWAFQGAYLSAFLFAVVALAGISLYAHYERESPRKTIGAKWLILPVSAAFLAECNLASGVLTWIMLPVCAALLGVRRRIVILLSGLALPAIGVYLVGYRTPGESSDPLQSIRSLTRVFAFVVANLAESWHFVGAGVGPAATVIALLAIAWFVVRKLLRAERLQPVQGFALCVALMMLLTAFVTALGRQGFGLQHARIGRYQTPAMLFWWALALLLMTSITRTDGRMAHYGAYVFVALQVIFLVLFLAEAGWFPELLQTYVSDGFTWSTAGLAVEAGIYDEPQIRYIFPKPSVVPPTYSFLIKQGLMTPPFEEFHDVGKNLGSVFSVLPAGTCVGSTELIHRIALHGDATQDLFAAGWGYYPAGKKTFRRVLAATPEGMIVGIGISGSYRPEVAAAHPGVLTAYTGWRLYAVSEGLANPLQVYGILPGTTEACLLPGTQRTPAILAQPLPPLSSITDTLRGYIESLNGVVVVNSNDAQHPAHIGRSVNLVIEGWVISADGRNGMDEVFGVYPSGHMAAIVVSRPDVGDVLKNGSLLMSRYRVTLPAGALGLGLQPIQIVGLRNDRFYKLTAVLYVYRD